jgi:hypothetical protein
VDRELRVGAQLIPERGFAQRGDLLGRYDAHETRIARGTMEWQDTRR